MSHRISPTSSFVSSAALLTTLALAGACPSVGEPPAVDARAPDDAPVPLVDAPGAPDAFSGAWSLTDAVAGPSNPNGPWSYGWAPTLGGSITLFPMRTTDAMYPGWIDPNHMSLATPQVWRNLGTAPHASVPVGMVSMHPGQAGEHAVARFAAPAAGRYVATMQAFLGATGATDATARVDGVLGATVAVDASNPTLMVPPTVLAEGDTIELWIGPHGSGADDNTPVTFTVSTVP